MSLRDEISPGLVLHLDPDKLEAAGATYTCAAAERVARSHFFLCLSVEQGTAKWIPMYSENNTGARILVSPTGRSGHPKWTRGTSYCHPAQVWTATHEAIEAAAGSDLSGPGKRNRLDPANLPQF